MFIHKLFDVGLYYRSSIFFFSYIHVNKNMWFTYAYLTYRRNGQNV